MSLVAYLTGTATSWTDLKSQLVTQLTANGYTYNATNNTFAKGNCAFSAIVSTGSGYASRLRFRGGTSVDGSGVLQNPGPSDVCMFDQFSGVPNYAQSFSFPINWRLFVWNSPDTIWLAVNHSGSYWQHFTCGVASGMGVAGIGGTSGVAGNSVPFYHGTFFDSGGTANIAATVLYNQASSNNAHCSIPFLQPNSYFGEIANRTNSFAYINEPLAFQRQSNITNATYLAWAGSTQGTQVGTNLAGSQATIYDTHCDSYMTARRTPNAWNNEAVLIPIRPTILRPSGFFSYGFELPHIRLIRNDFYADGDIITKGSDKWMVISGRKKNTTDREGGTFGDWSGTYAVALEYTGGP